MLTLTSTIFISLCVAFGGAFVAVCIATTLLLVAENCGFRTRRLLDSWLLGMLFIPTFVIAGAWTAGFGLQGLWPSWLPGFSPVNVAGKPILSVLVVIWIYGVMLMPLAWLLLRLGLRASNLSTWTLARMEGGFWSGVCYGFLPIAASWISVTVGVLAGLISTDMFVTNLFQVNTLTERSYQDLISGQNPITTIAGSTLLSWLVILLLHKDLLSRMKNFPATVDQVPQTSRMHRSLATRLFSTAVLFATVGALTIVPWTNLVLKAGWAVRELPTTNAQPIASAERGNLMNGEKFIEHRWSLLQTIQSVLEAPGRFSEEFYWSTCLVVSASILAILAGLPIAVAMKRSPLFFRRIAVYVIAAVFFLPGPTVNQIVLSLMQQEWLVWWNDHTLLAPVVCLQFRLFPIAVAWSFWFIDQWHYRYHHTWAIDDSLPIRSKLQILLRPVGWSVTRLWLILVLVSFSDLSTYMLCLPPGVTTISMRVFDLLHYGVRFQEAGLLFFIAVMGLGAGFLFVILSKTREEDAWL